MAELPLVCQTYEYSPNNEDSILSMLKLFLPYSLSIYRRIQSVQRSSSARILSTISPSRLSELISAKERPGFCFGAAFVDRSARPETESFIFLRSEVPETCSVNCKECNMVLLSILNHIPDLPLTLPDVGDQYSKTPYSAHARLPHLHLVGALAEPIVERIRNLDLLSDRLEVPETPYSHLIFDAENSKFSSVDETDLPKELIFRPLSSLDDFILVIQRTSIPRKVGTLMSLRSDAIFHLRDHDQASLGSDINTPTPDRPIAWAFIGQDGSLTSLHVEEEWRGKGIAKKIAVRVVKESMGSEGYGHAFVATNNLPSQAVCRSIGGTSIINRYWVLIDLEKVKHLKSQCSQNEQ
jgi:FR47-like protein